MACNGGLIFHNTVFFAFFAKLLRLSMVAPFCESFSRRSRISGTLSGYRSCGACHGGRGSCRRNRPGGPRHRGGCRRTQPFGHVHGIQLPGRRRGGESTVHLGIARRRTVPGRFANGLARHRLYRLPAPCAGSISIWNERCGSPGFPEFAAGLAGWQAGPGGEAVSRTRQAA